MLKNTIEAAKDTWIKSRPVQSSELAGDEKTFAPKGVLYNVDSYKRVKGGHWEVQIGGDIRYIFDAATHGPESHWICSWEQDDLDDDVPPSDQAISRAQQAQLGASIPVGPSLRPGDSFDTLITDHFTYGEICKYEEERRFLYEDQCETAFELCKFLEEVRSTFAGRPLRITSGHRPEPVNRRIGGAHFSEHLYRAPGMGAVDFYIEGVDTYQVEDYCDKNWPHSVGYGAVKGFVHLGIGRGRVRWPY